MVSPRTLRSRAHVLLLPLLGLPLLALVPVKTEQYAALWLAVSNAGHLPLFGLFATGIFFALPHRLARQPGRYVTTVAISTLTAVCIEAVQSLFNRTPSLEDAMTGVLGITLALGGIAVWTHQTARVLRIAYAGLIILILFWLFTPAWHETRVLVWSTQHFPVLGDFEDRIELQLWRAKSDLHGQLTSVARSEQYVTSGRHSLEVRTGWGSWSGVRYTIPPQDWRKFRELHLDVYNPGRDFHLRLRLEDAESQNGQARFMKRFDMQPGWNQLRVPLSDFREAAQALDLGAVTQLILYVGEHEPARVFYVDHVRLY
jgi:hypothetical protein